MLKPDLTTKAQRHKERAGQGEQPVPRLRCPGPRETPLVAPVHHSLSDGGSFKIKTFTSLHGVTFIPPFSHENGKSVSSSLPLKNRGGLEADSFIEGESDSFGAIPKTPAKGGRRQIGGLPATPYHQMHSIHDHLRIHREFFD